MFDKIYLINKIIFLSILKILLFPSTFFYFWKSKGSFFPNLNFFFILHRKSLNFNHQIDKITIHLYMSSSEGSKMSLIYSIRMVSLRDRRDLMFSDTIYQFR